MAQYSNFPSQINVNQLGVWTVGLSNGTNVGLNAGNNNIGNVGLVSGTVLALSAGTNTIGSVNQAGTWTVGLSSGTTVAATQSGTWNFSFAAGASIISLPNYFKSGTYNLTTAGTQTTGLNVNNYSRITCQYTVATIGTSVTVQIEGSCDGTNWTNLAADELSTTRTSNGSYMFIINNVSLNQIRLNWISSVGGTPTINVVFIAS